MHGDIHFWRQAWVVAADCVHELSVGMALPLPALLRAADVGAAQEHVAWINAVYGVGGAAGFCVVPAVMQRYGRKITFIILNVVVGVGFVMIALAENVETLYAARAIQGVSMSGVYITSIIIAEYSCPRRRGYFISLQKGSIALGSLACHALALAWPWRRVAGAAAGASALALALACRWRESPAFLAMRGRYAECDAAFVYLRGDTPGGRRELDALLAAQESRRGAGAAGGRRAFLVPLLVVALLTVVLNACGRYFNLVFVARALAAATGDGAAAAYCSLALDALAALATAASAAPVARWPRRALLFAFGGCSACLLLSISLIAYLQASGVIGDAAWPVPSVILLNSFVSSFGVVPVCFAISGEIFPLEHRGRGSTAAGLVFAAVYALAMKLTPPLLEAGGVHGTYAVNGLCSLVCLAILYFVLPETKDKTLQQIEDEMRSAPSGGAAAARRERAALAAG